MKANSERTYWLTDENWHRVNKEKDCFELTDAAPEQAKKNFEDFTRLEASRKAVRETIDYDAERAEAMNEKFGIID